MPINIKNGAEIARMREAGSVVALIHARIQEAIAPGVTTAKLDAIARDTLGEAGARSSFLGYHGFPGHICASVNEEIVHGIPGRRVLGEGDIVSIDVGVGYRGYFTDSAVTVPVGQVDTEAERLLSVTQASLAAGIAAARAGEHIGDIGAAVQAVVERAGFSVVRDLVGHGIGAEFHEEPQVPNYGKPKRGVKLVPGLTLAIEPMVNAGGPATRTLPDKWTIVTVDGSRSAHFEHTIAITENGPRVLTQAA
jgi:methionyl aminopeptidase